MQRDKMSMNKRAGDVVSYFEVMSKTLSTNDGIGQCRTIRSDAYSVPAPVKSLQYTKLAITNPSLDVVNLDKGYITAKFRQKVRLALDSTIDYNILQTKKLASSYTIFIGFKSASHMMDQYRLYHNNVKIYDQSEALYEQIAMYNCKPQEEVRRRGGMYSTFDEVYKVGQNVAGCYVSLFDLMQGDLDVEFECMIQLDDLAPLSPLEQYPNSIVGQLELEFRYNLEKNMVFALCGVEESFEARSTMYSDQIYPTALMIRDSKTKIQNRFNQFGDKIAFSFTVLDSGDAPSIKESTGTMQLLSSEIYDLKSSVSGFNLKSEAKQALHKMFSDSTVIIPTQTVNTSLFSQRVHSGGFNLSTTLSLNKTTMLMMLFPRTANQGSVSMNPYQNNLHLMIDGVRYPDRSVSSTDKSFHEMTCSHLGFDGLFSVNSSLSEGILFKEYDTGTTRTLRCKTDDTNFMFTVMTERYNAPNVFDGISNPAAQVILQSDHLDGSKNPAYFTGGVLNVHAENVRVILVSDSIWAMRVGELAVVDLPVGY